MFLGIDEIGSEAERIARAQAIDPIERLRELVYVEEVRGSRILRISADYPDPQIAADIANAITDAYLAHILQSRTRTGVAAKDNMSIERDKALAAWRSYQLGELDEAREAATAAAAIVDIYAPLARWLAAERQLPAADVLRQLGDVEVWRVGTFNAAAALAVWDAEHREAFCAWARAPWFC